MHRTLAAAGLVFAVTVPGGAQAAPQILALAQTHGTVPMHCADGICYAELSAICLQEKRDVPRSGAGYRPLKRGMVTLVMHMKDGRKIEKPAVDLATIMAWRGHAAVRLVVAKKRVASYGAVKVSVRVNALATLEPIPVPGDVKPQTKADIERAQGQQRTLAYGFLDRATPNGIASRIINRMLNRLPAGNGADPKFRKKLWQSEIDRSQARTKSEAVRRGVELARKWARICKGYAHRPGQFKTCLVTAHDTMMGKTNQKYWKIDGAGG
jgi:hypothetical protein